MNDFPFKLLRREPIYEQDVVRVPLEEPDPRTGQPAFATLDRADFERLCRSESPMTDQWTLNRSGGGRFYVRAGEPFVTVARVLMRAGRRQVVKYLDGDPTNLQRGNLELTRWRDSRLRAARVPALKRRPPDPAKVEAAAEIIREFLRTGRATGKSIAAVGVLARAINHPTEGHE